MFDDYMNSPSCDYRYAAIGMDFKGYFIFERARWFKTKRVAEQFGKDAFTMYAIAHHKPRTERKS